MALGTSNLCAKKYTHCIIDVWQCHTSIAQLVANSWVIPEFAICCEHGEYPCVVRCVIGNRLLYPIHVGFKNKALDVRSFFKTKDICPEVVEMADVVWTGQEIINEIDAFLFNELGLNQFIRRTPIWGLGCAGGVAGIARACDWLKAYPEKNALVVSVELCSLTFVRQDLSKSNLIATSLFGDGASAVLLCGDRSKIRSDRMLRVLFSDSITWRNTLDVMGWDVGENGLSVVFSKSIPSITMEFARPAIVQFLTRHNLGLSDIAVLLSHPGGPKIIAALERALEMTDAQTRYMRSVQSKYGNMSSTTVLFVLNEFMRSQEFRPGMKLLSSSLGPGFSMESFVAESE